MQRKIIVLLTITMMLAPFADLISNENVKADGTSTFENEQDISPNYFNFKMEYPTFTDIDTTIQTDYYFSEETEIKYCNRQYVDIAATKAKQLIDTCYTITVIDVRNFDEYNTYHMSGAINIPLSEFGCTSCLFNKLKSSKDNILIVYCQDGDKSPFARELLIENGFQNVYNLIGGLDDWVEKDFAVSTSADSNKKEYFTGLILEDPAEIPEKPYPFGGKYGMLSLLSQFDWRDYNGEDWTTPIRDQGNCGSCWAFAAMGTLESIVNIRNDLPGLDLDLSEQYILSCLPSAGSCSGGWVSRAFQYIMDTSADGNYHNGVVHESCFPYQADDSIPCSAKCSNWENLLTPIMDYGIEYSPSDDEIKQMLVESGPSAVSMTVYTDFKSYSGGIYEHSWGGFEGNHAVVIVGYNDNMENPDEPGYWICKNSWGTWWGESGWFRIAYGECGIGSRVYWVDYAETTISVTIHRIKEIDDMDWFSTNWYYDVSAGNGTEWRTERKYCTSGSDVVVDKTHILGLHTLYPTIKIKLMEDDFWTGDDLADISGYPGGGVDDSTPDIRGTIYHGYYNLLNNSLTGDTTYLDGMYLSTSGEHPPDSSTTTDENDAKIWFSISDNYELPTAAAGPDKTVGAGETVNFDAFDSTASDGSILTTYEWDWDNNGVYDESYITPTANHTWTEGGTYTVILRVTDNYNETSSDSCQIIVDPARPIALFTYSPSNPFINQIITFDASSSYDLDGTIDLYEWDWDNNDVYDESSVVPIVWHFFSTAGYKYVTLRVFDNDGYNDTYSEWIYVIQARFTGDLYDSGLDSNSDGLYDYLVVEAEVEVFEAGEYRLSGGLYY
jgi:C1A family cysteine protease